MNFGKRLAALRKERGMTQQALSDLTAINVVQIRRYETAKSEPTLAVLRKLARGLSVPGDALMFDPEERAPAEDLRLQFEDASRLSPDEKHILKVLIEGLLLQHEADARSLRLSRAG